MFERFDFSFRPIIKDTIFPVYFCFEGVAIWGLGFTGAVRISIRLLIMGGTLSFLFFSHMKTKVHVNFVQQNIYRVKSSFSGLLSLLTRLSTQ